MKEPFILYIDATYFAIGVVLVQVHIGLERVIGHASKSMSKIRIRYSTKKREILAIVKYSRQFKHYFLGWRLKITLDYRVLHKFKDPVALTARWLEKLIALRCEIEYRHGKSIGQADGMSRLPASAAALNMTTLLLTSRGIPRWKIIFLQIV